MQFKNYMIRPTHKKNTFTCAFLICNVVYFFAIISVFFEMVTIISIVFANIRFSSVVVS